MIADFVSIGQLYFAIYYYRLATLVAGLTWRKLALKT